jgi:hypothetical protein
MTGHRSAALTVSAAVLAATLFGCNRPPPSAQEQADAATRAACQQRAEEAYNQRNRGEIFSPQSQVNTPYSGNYLPADSDRGLSELFVHDRMVSDCVRNTGTDSERSPPAGFAPQPTPRPSASSPLPLPPPPPRR